MPKVDANKNAQIVLFTRKSSNFLTLHEFNVIK